MNYFYIFLISLVSLSLGYDLFFAQSFNKGLILSPSQHKQVLMKLVLSASFKIFLIIKTLIIIVSIFFAVYIISFQIVVKVFWWLMFFVCVFNGLYYIGYLLPKLNRIIHWDLKNPVEKWDEVYKSYNRASKILISISVFNFLLVWITFLLSYLFRLS